ncbi:hypothetical protein [Nocardia pseudobrasiliensis]|uniref:Uncharacterized protein n=1 Tax=Nocardia pseudobrasiliensis TaxID=45979 RepID=A0A370ID59_9NOCA|nr:hypothetical protein [Nocardia pseudobrasiliensis]RDI68657.1 hypothetical protein DFR76_101192 [Nocardia pseudobrasiliensis]
MDGSRRLSAKVAGPAVAAGAVSLGLILIGSCGLGRHDIYVAPPALNADLQSAPTTGRSGSSTPAVAIPPSPTWRVAVNTPPRRTLTSGSATTSPGHSPDATDNPQVRADFPRAPESSTPTAEPTRTIEPSDDSDLTTTTTKSLPTTTSTPAPLPIPTTHSSDTQESTVPTVAPETTTSTPAAEPTTAPVTVAPVTTAEAAAGTSIRPRSN